VARDRTIPVLKYAVRRDDIFTPPHLNKSGDARSRSRPRAHTCRFPSRIESLAAICSFQLGRWHPMQIAAGRIQRQRSTRSNRRSIAPTSTSQSRLELNLLLRLSRLRRLRSNTVVGQALGEGYGLLLRREPPFLLGTFVKDGPVPPKGADYCVTHYFPPPTHSDRLALGSASSIVIHTSERNYTSRYWGNGRRPPSVGGRTAVASWDAATWCSRLTP